VGPCSPTTTPRRRSPAESAPAAHFCAIAEALVGPCSPVSDKAVSKEAIVGATLAF
jgi:hypothetical protein